jgi:hypothetical protein
MSSSIRLIFALFIAAMATACYHTESLRAGDYVRWVQDPANGLRVNKQIGDIEYSLQYKPLDFVILQSNGKVFTKSQAAILKKDFEGMEYFTFRLRSLSQNNALEETSDSPGDENGRLGHFINNVQDDFTLVAGSDTIPCSLCQYERDYGITPYQTFSIGFNKQANSYKGNFTLIYSDQVMGTGPVSITIDASAIENIPHLQYQ